MGESQIGDPGGEISYISAVEQLNEFSRDRKIASRTKNLTDLALNTRGVFDSLEIITTKVGTRARGGDERYLGFTYREDDVENIGKDTYLGIELEIVSGSNSQLTALWEKEIDACFKKAKIEREREVGITLRIGILPGESIEMEIGVNNDNLKVPLGGLQLPKDMLIPKQPEANRAKAFSSRVQQRDYRPEDNKDDSTTQQNYLRILQKCGATLLELTRE